MDAFSSLEPRPPGTPYHSQVDVESTWAVVMDRREELHQISALKFRQVETDLRRKIVDNALDMLLLSPEGFAKVVQMWQELEAEGVLPRLHHKTGAVE